MSQPEEGADNLKEINSDGSGDHSGHGGLHAPSKTDAIEQDDGNGRLRDVACQRHLAVVGEWGEQAFAIALPMMVLNPMPKRTEKMV